MRADVEKRLVPAKRKIVMDGIGAHRLFRLAMHVTPEMEIRGILYQPQRIGRR